MQTMLEFQDNLLHVQHFGPSKSKTYLAKNTQGQRVRPSHQ